MAIIIVPCLLFYMMLRHDKREGCESDKAFDLLVKTIYFEGDVLSAPVYNNSTLLCIKIDTTSVDSFYYFSRDWALCIRDSVAVIPIGIIDKFDSADHFKTTAQRVVVNRGFNKKSIFIRGSDTLTINFDLWPAKLEEVHLLMAWENTLDSICSEK
ncbi:MAG: hypothetical protein IK126_02195 [Bacteroidales bacterium]|nr:hypothetical protein [Bacteroidales bacterium]